MNLEFDLFAFGLSRVRDPNSEGGRWLRAWRRSIRIPLEDIYTTHKSINGCTFDGKET